jgi:branched-chain amino acid aminotransferase
MSEFTAYFNGEWVPNSEVVISPFDRGFTMGDAVFDVERTFDGKLFRLEDHMDRLYRSLQYTHMDSGMTRAEMTELTLELVRRNEPLRSSGGDFTVRQVVTRGMTSTGSQGNVTDDLTPTVINMVSAIDFSLYAHYYETGASVVIPGIRSYSSDTMDPKAKHYSRANFVQAQLQVAAIDPHAYPVLLDQQGNISENVAANFFIVTDNVLRTSRDRSILQGISRKVALELAEQLEIEVVEDDLQPYDAYTADEAFLTTSSYQLLPVSTIDQRRVGDEIPGPISRQLLAAWSEMAGVDIVDQAMSWRNPSG